MTIGTRRFIFEHAGITEIASLLQILLSNLGEPYQMSYEEKDQIIHFEQDLCFYSLKVINARGVMVEVDCG